MASRATRGESGQATTELVIVFPALLALVFFVVQFGLWFHAKNVADAAAQEAVRAARLEGGTDLDGEARGDALMTDLGSVFTTWDVEVGRDGERVTARVTGQVQRVGGLSLTVDEVAEGPIERFRPDDGVGG